MIPNTDLTIYNKYTDPTTRDEKFQRCEVKNVVWENRKASNGRTSGLLASNTATVFFPFAVGANYVKPKAWLALVTKTGKWTLKEGDVLVKGIVADEITGPFTIASLQAKYDDVVTITSVDTMD